MNGQAPSVGRTVHYQSLGSADGKYPSLARAAIITELVPEKSTPDYPCVSLCVLNPEGMQFVRNVVFAREPRSGCWSWPPRVP
jgi:hypothetical protein